MNKKILVIVFLLIIIVLTSITTSYGFGISDLKGSKTGEEAKISEVGNGIIKVISTVGAILSVIVLIVIGIKYMFSSVEEKAQYKKIMLPYVIGAVLVFAASTIASIIYGVAIEL